MVLELWLAEQDWWEVRTMTNCIEIAILVAVALLVVPPLLKALYWYMKGLLRWR